jgi:hypothetical protein
MNLHAPKARMSIGPKERCRWRSNGHLLRCRACFAKRAERAIGSARSPREALSGAHIRVQGASLLGQANGEWYRRRLRAARGAFRCSGRLASDAFLNSVPPESTRAVL